MSSLRSFLDSFMARRPTGEPGTPAGEDRSAVVPAVDAGEEFQKVQRSLRRLSMASDRSGEILQTVSTRLDEIQQRLLAMSRPARGGVSLEEAQLLSVLDQLERAAGMMEEAAPALEPVAAARDALLKGAGWQPLALRGAAPEGTAIRIAEFAGDGGHDDVRIARILEQGYRRHDGTLLRPAVVIAAPAGSQSLS